MSHPPCAHAPPRAGCRFCHLAATRDDYRALWGMPPLGTPDRDRCRFEGDAVEYPPCGCVRKVVRVCEHDAADWSRCTRGESADPDVQSCQRCPLKVVTA
jgi:dissimilatory sulfite reductase (desulfoviridin) alpha/beta subunit